MPQDLYQTLGVDRTATPDVIKKAYRRLAKDLHPDRNPGDDASQERFKKVGAAYDVLSDAERRKLYDEFGDESLRVGFDEQQARAARAWQGRGGPRFGGGFGGFGDGGFVDLSELFGAGGGFGGGRGGPARGPDVSAELELPFLDAARGGIHTLSLGSGPVRVRIPAGTDDGDRVRIPGHGGPGRGAPGDLIVTVRVRPDARFRAEGRDLVVPLVVTVPEAILGAKVPVETLDGAVVVTVPPGSSSGRRMRLAGRGMPGRKGLPAGDLYVEIRIVLPEIPVGDDRAARAAELLAGLYRGDPRET
jgi:DnaJ-class molecular chaperone